MPALREAVPKPFTKEIVTKGFGYHTPQDGSVCKIKVSSDPMHIIDGLNDQSEKEVVIGDVDESTDRIIEDCIRTMKEEEVCCLKFVHPSLYPENIVLEEMKCDVKDEAKPNSDVEKSSDANEVAKNDSEAETVVTPQSEAPDVKTDVELPEKSESEKLQNDPESTASKEQPNSGVTEEQPNPGVIEEQPNPGVTEEQPMIVEIQFQLLTYTREPEIWEMSITEKWRRASYHKQRGLSLYSRGAYQYAFRRFGLVLKYVISLEHDVPSGQEEGMDIKGLKLSCYLNVAACQMRHHNYESVVINSSKALTIQPKNAKALYRRGAAYLQLQEYEKAKEDLLAAQQLEPKNPAIAKQLQLLKGHVQKLNQYYATAMKKLFN